MISSFIHLYQNTQVTGESLVTPLKTFSNYMGGKVQSTEGGKKAAWIVSHVALGIFAYPIFSVPAGIGMTVKFAATRLYLTKKTENERPFSASPTNSQLPLYLSALNQPSSERQKPWEQFHRKDLFKRISREDWSTLLEQIAKVNEEELSTDALRAFESGEWGHCIFQNDSWPLFALRAHFKGLLEEKYLPKLALYHAATQETISESGVETFQLLDTNGKINDAAMEAFTEGLMGARSYFTKEELSRLVEFLSQLPCETTQFFRIEHRRIDDPEKPEAVFRILEGTRLTPFLIPLTETYKQVVIPPCFVDVILGIKFGDNARRAQPVFGFRNIEKLSDISKRPVALSFPRYIPLPKRLHDFSTTPLGTYHHDALYHLWMDSSNPHRKALVQFILYMKSKGHEIANWLDGDSYIYKRKALFGHADLCGMNLKTDKDFFFGDIISNIVFLSSHDNYHEIVDLFWEYLSDPERSEELGKEYDLGMEAFKTFLVNISNTIDTPKWSSISLSSPEYIARLFAKKAGLDEPFKLWPGYPSFSERTNLLTSFSESQLSELRKIYPNALEIRDWKSFY